MPIYMDVLPIERLVVILARGKVTAAEIAENAKKLVAANVPEYAKIIDVAGSASDLTKEEVDGIALMLRGRPEAESRGPVAFIVSSGGQDFADAFAEATQGDRPVELFESLHEARRWLKAKRSGSAWP